MKITPTSPKDFKSHQYNTTANLQADPTWRLTDMIQFYCDMGYTSDTDYNGYRVDMGLRFSWQRR